MPNWCACFLNLYGSKTWRDKVLKTIGGKHEDTGNIEVFSLNSIIEDPRYGQNDNHNFDWQGQYDWRMENWGVRGDTYEVELKKHDKRETTIFFLTAWSPPKFPDIEWELLFAE